MRRSPCGLAEAGTSPSPGVRKRWCRSCSPSLGSIRQIFGAAPRPRDGCTGVLRYKVLELLKEDRFWRKHLIRAAGEMPASPEDDFQQRAEITSILTPEEYEILRKLYLEKYTYEELAREMGLKKSALAMRVKRSKERFVKQWNRH